MRLSWTKVGHGVWVDHCGLHCIRLLSTGTHGYEDFPGDVYEGRETYPGLPVDVVALASDLHTAKLACQARFDGDIEEAA